jgi:hypothetical protein
MATVTYRFLLVLPLIVAFIAGVRLLPRVANTGQFFFNGDITLTSNTDELVSNASRQVREMPLAFGPLVKVSLEATERGVLLIAEHFRLRTKYTPKVPVSHILHASRLWLSPLYSLDTRFPPDDSIGAEFTIITPDEMLRVLFDHESYAKFYLKGSGVPDLLRKTTYGIGVHLADGPGAPGGEAHVDQLLKVASEIGLSRDTPVFTPQGSGTVGDIVVNSIMHFSMHQELEFTAISYSRYLPPARTWTNRFGRTYSFDDMAAELISKTRGAGCCYGAHVPYALISIVRADRVHPIISDYTRRSIRHYFGELASSLEEKQHKEGWWDAGWGEELPAQDADSSLQRRLRATGHHLEWMAFAPEDHRPSDVAMARAADYLVLQLSQMPLAHSQVFFPPLTHAVRSLLLITRREKAGRE